MTPRTKGSSKDNILKFETCYGCGVCACICPKDIISIRLDEDGFYRPTIDDINKCINCHLCLEVCAFADNTINKNNHIEIKSYAAWSNDFQVRNNSTSGGISFEIAKTLIEEGYKACGVRYNGEGRRAEHFIADTIEDFSPSIGSKYIQSYTLTGFSMLQRDAKYMIVGTPCQIHSLRKMIQRNKLEDNYILIDFFCHGVPSMLMWNKYLLEIEDKIGEVVYNPSWRNKSLGWQNSYVINVPSKNGFKYFSPYSKGDLFFRFFLKDKCLCKSCYHNCKYKMTSSAADIRISDLWGKTYKDNKDGVSGILVLTSKGQDVIENLDNCTIIEEPLSVVTEMQMTKNAKLPLSYHVVKRLLKTRTKLRTIYTLAYLIDFLRDVFPVKIKYYSMRIYQELKSHL